MSLIAFHAALLVKGAVSWHVCERARVRMHMGLYIPSKTASTSTRLYGMMAGSNNSVCILHLTSFCTLTTTRVIMGSDDAGQSGTGALPYGPHNNI